MNYDDDPVKRVAQQRFTPNAPKYLGMRGSNHDLVGLRGEQALHEYFGVPFTPTSSPMGDGGKDLVIPLAFMVAHNLQVRDYILDIKTYRKPYHHMVKIETKVIEDAIYPLGGYNDATDKAYVCERGWLWGWEVLKGEQTDRYGGHKAWVSDLGVTHKMSELLSRYETAKKFRRSGRDI